MLGYSAGEHETGTAELHQVLGSTADVTGGNRCRSCKAPVVWARSRSTQRWMIIDEEPASRGNLELRIEGGVTWAAHVGPSESEPRHLDHHATCPDREAWRRRAVHA